MNDLKRYYGVIIFLLGVILLIYFSFNFINTNISAYSESSQKLESAEAGLTKIKQEEMVVKDKINKLKNVKTTVLAKKIYAPTESDLGTDSLFFVLYTDLIEMLRNNSVKIKSIDYKYNPEGDNFVQYGKDAYFVCDIDLKLSSNFVDLGKLVQDIYQYPYYIKIRGIKIIPYEKDRKILLTDLKIRLYSYVEPKEDEQNNNN